MTPTPTPEEGQLVDVRNRRFVVTNVRRSAITSPDPLAKPQHLVSLSSVDDEGLGEELNVIWEIEPGVRAFEKASLPDLTGFDDPKRLDAFLDAVRWGAASSADVRSLHSPFRSAIEIEDYQLDPVVRALRMPRVSLLIADDVGLGKTIEAGLVAQEMIFRHMARRILIVCPSSLQIQWQEQMRDKFGLEFRIIDSAAIKHLRRTRGIHTNPWQHFPRLITSIDYLKRDRPLRSFRDILPPEGTVKYPRPLDLLIVDEAHNMAPAGGGQYATDSLRTAAIRLLAPHFEHKLFLTATPHNGFTESFTALLELLDSQRFARTVTPDRAQLQTVMVRRLKQELTTWDGSPRFPQRLIVPIEVNYTNAERDAHRKLREYTKLRATNAKDASERYATEFVLKLLKKRLFSSPAAFASTLAKHETSVSTARRRSTSPSPAISLLKKRLDQRLDEDYADDLAYEDATSAAVSDATRLFTDLSSEERRLLSELKEWAEASSARPDSKATELLTWLNTHIKKGKQWSDQRVLIFTEYRATQKWLHSLLITEGYTGEDRLMTLYGGMDPKDREKVKAAFQAGPTESPVRILLATDAASEGLDLQNHCSRLIHYEIPWNPNRMEQRNGRIDRYGQKAEHPEIFHFVGKGFETQRELSAAASPGDLDDDLEFLMRAVLKVETIREDLGKVGPVIAQQVEEAMLGKRSRLDTKAAEKEAQPVRQLLKFEQKIRDQIEKLREQLQETKRTLRLSPENTESVVSIGLELAGQPALIPTKREGLNGPVFQLPAFRGTWATCSEGLAHKHTGVIRPIVFDPDLMRGRDDVVLVHLNHKLVQMCLRLLRAEVWSNESRRKLNRVTARLVPTSVLDTPAVIAHGRIVVLGSDQHRLHEEVIVAGGTLRDGRFSRMNIGQTQAALDAALDEPAPSHLQSSFHRLWSKIEPQVMQALEAKMRDRADSLTKQLDDRAEKEIFDITKVMEELQVSILKELTTPGVSSQLTLYDMEREQRDSDVRALEARLNQIPQEIKQEAARIRSRFANPVPRLFPLSITFLAPQSLVIGGAH
jgi:superfamily II DNA/RNA helicase